MKQLLIGCSVIIASTSLMVNCRNTNKAKNVTIVPIESKNTTRIKTASGLEYEILQEGSGDCPSVGDELTVHYNGWLYIDGEFGDLFDSSVLRDKPYTFIIGVGRVIKGWEEGVMTMKVGEKRRLFIPSELGYGKRGVKHLIPANTDLIFDVELISIS
jgi:peptidylprolyl isomerase